MIRFYRECGLGDFDPKMKAMEKSLLQQELEAQKCQYQEDMKWMAEEHASALQLLQTQLADKAAKEREAKLKASNTSTLGSTGTALSQLSHNQQSGIKPTRAVNPKCPLHWLPFDPEKPSCYKRNNRWKKK